MLGYVKNIKNLEKFSKIHYLETGDIAYFNKKKFYFLKGRNLDLLKLIMLDII